VPTRLRGKTLTRRASRPADGLPSTAAEWGTSSFAANSSMLCALNTATQQATCSGDGGCAVGPRRRPRPARRRRLHGAGRRLAHAARLAPVYARRDRVPPSLTPTRPTPSTVQA
jgi:hypothetical protein